MVAALAITPASGSITAKKTACRVDVTGAAANRAPDNTGGAFNYIIVGTCDGVDDLVSYGFNVSSDGKHTWNSLVFPEAGSWTLTLTDTADDSADATLAVTVSE